MNTEQSCRHAVGTAKQEYYDGLVFADEDGNGVDCGCSLHEFNFCPYCGEDVREMAAHVESLIRAHEEAFWQRYHQQHGEQEYRRARNLPAMA